MKKIRGLPVTVKVPTHLQITVVERRFYQPGGDFAYIPGATSRIVTEEVQHKDQVFMVDSARPGAGTLNMSAGFENEKNPQFFSTYNSKIDDQTIKTITALIPNLPDVLSNLKKARAIAASGAPAEASLAMAYTDHVVAVKVFDVYDPSLTEHVMCFMNEYVNNCKPHCTAPACVAK